MTGESLVSCYSNVVAFLLVAGLVLLSRRIREKKNREFRLFFFLCFFVLVGCLTCFIFYAMRGQTIRFSRTASIISRTLLEYSVLQIVYLWIVYVDNKLYGKRDRRSFWRIVMFVPVSGFSVLLVINLFTGIVFTITEDNYFKPGGLYFLLIILYYMYFAASVIVVKLYDRNVSKMRFFRITPMIISVLVGTSVSLFSPYSTDMLGYAVGITLLYFSLVTEMRYEDRESGLYNKAYMSHVMDMTAMGKCDYRSALIFEIDGNKAASYKIMKKELMKTGDVIRVDEDRFAIFSEKESRAKMQMISSVFEEEVEKYNADHPDDKILMKARYRTRGSSEDAFSFIQNAADEKETGDSLMGVVSMMSELDRLDQELKLAADIQVNMLPTNFPPFPDRKEFDLYAFMTPAKEVGGDFYDFFMTDSDHLAMVISDVSGKGIPAALFMMVAKALIRNQLMEGTGPAEALKNVNLQLYERNASMMFVTVWLALLEISTGKGLVCNAGHENPVIKRSGGTFEVLKYKHSMPVGVLDIARYEEREFILAPGDSVFVYTDGVPEATNAAEELFGEDRMTDALNRDPDASPEQLIANVYKAVTGFAGEAPQFDDITMLCLKYNGSEANG